MMFPTLRMKNLPNKLVNEREEPGKAQLKMRSQLSWTDNYLSRAWMMFLKKKGMMAQ